MQNQMLTNSLNQHNLAMRALPLDVLKVAVMKVGELYHGRQLEAVMSSMNGVGKTHHILRRVAEIQKVNNNMPVLHHVELRETTDVSALVTALLADPTDPRLPTAVYIDLAHILPSHVDSLLFELLIVGVLRDPQHCAVYHRRKQDAFFVEIPNTPNDHTAKQMPFCRMLPPTYLRMGPEVLDSEMPVLRSDGAIYVEFVRNECMEIVGKTLDAMKYKKFNPKSPQFQVSWTAANAASVDTGTIYDLLEDFCCSETSPAAFLVFTNFVKFLGNLVISAEQWNMMNLQLLQHFDPGLKHFKDCLFRLLMETSRDFALRQVPKTMTVHDRPSPLAPASVRSMVRGTPYSPHTPFSPPALAGRTHIGPAAVAEEAGGVGRVAAIDYAPRFDQMSSWENSRHPVASFRKNDNGNIIGCNIMSLRKDFLGEFIDPVLQNSLSLNDLKLERDWTKVTYEEAVELVIQIEGGDLLRRTGQAPAPRSPDYVVTIDNLLKLMSIQQRLKYGLPVILMGETGCGKTALVKFLSKTLHFRLMTLDIHGGITDQTIMDFLDKAIEESASTADNQRGVLVFFDEINAANCMALFKTIIIDRVYGNKVIPSKIRIISCCNPYRVRKTSELEQVALVFQHQATNNTTAVLDPMKSLIYRVHPLPESLIDVVSDFGALSERSEELYINSIIRKELSRADQPDGADEQDPNGFDTFLDAFRDLLCQSQSFVREVNGGERSVVSMRDIARAARVFKWFLTQYFRLRGVEHIAVTVDDDGVMCLPITPDTKPHLRNAVILTLGYCYHARLNRDQRWGYRNRICSTWKKMLPERPSVQWLKLDNAKEFESMLIETQREFVSEMDLGEGIALNEALRENLFMLLVSIMNQIPILLIGKPGCSKSLAMGVLRENLIGEVSSKKIFKTMPSVDVFAYQCSPLSTPEAILSAFRSARQSNLKHESNIVCVLLDEVGLAEESPHLPLKVLHRELEDLQGIACVGISNWALDAAKMSRCVTLYRPPPTVDDLCVTAEGMVASANLKAYLKPLSEAFYEMYKSQRIEDFWGMREFYSTVRVINMELRKRAADGLDAVLEPQVLMKTVQRNFGGQSVGDLNQCIEEFFERCSMDENGSGVTRYMISDLIQQNLKEPDARHLMLLTKNNAALRLLFESNLLDYSTAKVMFGSTFSSDQSDIFVALNLQKIKGYMQQPISLVLVHCDSLYESLYDLLNQHYMEFAGQRYVRIAHGSKAKQCPIHRLFRVIVITEMYDAYYRLAPPLLNRFEKQVFLRKDLMTRADEALLAKLVRFWNVLLGVVNDRKQREEPDGDISMAPERENLVPEVQNDQEAEGPRYRPVVGYHPEMLTSLVFTLRRRFGSGKNIDQLFALAKELLMWVMTPEAVCIIASRCDRPTLEMKFGVDLVSEYFHKQRHSDLPSFTEVLLQSKSNWCDELGAQVMITTYSPIRGFIKPDLEHFASDGGSIMEVSLHEFSSSQDIDKAVKSFYVGGVGEAQGGKRFLLIHADPAAASLRVIEHARFVCETERAEARAKSTESGAVGSMFVLLIVHLQRGTDAKFSFDFDSQWHFAFLDSVEPSVDLNSMPLLGEMLHMPLTQVVQGLDFEKLLQTCFRASLSRLIYPKSRKPEDLHQQIQLILSYLADAEFVKLVRDWVLRILETTPKNPQNEEEGSFGDDTTWFAAIATAAHELAMAGTFRAALHNRVAVLVGSLLTVLLAHLDRNQGLDLLQEPPKRKLWLNMYAASLTSNLSVQLKHQAVQALGEDATAQHEVGTDAQTGAKPFVSRFPASWFASKSIDGERHMMESLPSEKQLAALEEQYKISRLQEVGLDPMLPPDLLDDYLHDFTAMHVDWTARIDRNVQTRILSKTLTRFMNQIAPGQRQVTSILEVHQAFWRQEKQVDYFIKLLNAVPDAVPQAERLIETSDLRTLIEEALRPVPPS